MPGIDDTFLALPHRRLGELALARAADLGASHADFRFERIRSQRILVRDGALQGAADADVVGFAVRVVHGGAWGFAAGVVLTDDEAVRVAETAVSVAKVAAAMTTTPVELAPEPVYDDVTWVSSYDIDPFGVSTADKTAVLADWTVRLCRGSAVDHATASLYAVQENKYYADLAGTRTTQQRVRLQPGFEAMGGTSEVFDSMASIAPPVGRGWEYVVGDPSAPQQRGLGLGGRARRGARPAGGEAQGADRRGRPLRPGDPPVQPVAHDPRVDRPRHRAGPRARLRGQLRRHQLRHARPDRDPPLRQPGHAGHRRPDHRARPRHHRLRRRRGGHPAVGHRPRRRCSSASSSTGRWLR